MANVIIGHLDNGSYKVVFEWEGLDADRDAYIGVLLFVLRISSLLGCSELRALKSTQLRASSPRAPLFFPSCIGVKNVPIAMPYPEEYES